MARRARGPGRPAANTDRQRLLNGARKIDAIADRHAQSHGWAIDNARNYLSRVLSYAVGQDHLQAIKLFAEKAAQLGLIQKTKPLDLYTPRRA
ncbi:MAG: hypothetical protein R3C45_19765 [Phycisphaerales bacterium]